MGPLPAQPQSFCQKNAVLMALAEFHQPNATAQRCEKQHLHLQWSAPHIHGAVNHEGAVGNEQHWCAFEAGMQHQIQQQLQPGALPDSDKVDVPTAFDVNPAKNRPPEACVHGCDATDRALAVIRNQFPFFFHKAGGKDTARLNVGALEVEADAQKLLHDGEAAFEHQVDHHGNVVPQEDLSVVECLISAPMFHRCNAAGEFPLHAYQRGFEVFPCFCSTCSSFELGRKRWLCSVKRVGIAVTSN